VPREGTGVGPQAKRKYLAQLRDRYVRAKGRQEKGRLLGEAVSVTGYHRKAIIRAWRRAAPTDRRPRRRGRARQYGPAVVRVLKAIWEVSGYPWSARLKALLPLWLPWAVAVGARDRARRTPDQRAADRPALGRRQTAPAPLPVWAHQAGPVVEASHSREDRPLGLSPSRASPKSTW
jgi:hypothetical protein